MNIKVILNKKVHKLPQEQAKSLDTVQNALKNIYKDRLPEKYSLFVELADKQRYAIENNEDFQQTLNIIQEQEKKSFKIFVEKNQIDNDLSKSRVMDFMMNSQMQLGEPEQQQQLQDQENKLNSKLKNWGKDEEELEKLTKKLHIEDKNEEKQEQEQIQEKKEEGQEQEQQQDEQLKPKDEDIQQVEEEVQIKELNKEFADKLQNFEKESLNQGFQYRGSIFEDSALFPNSKLEENGKNTDQIKENNENQIQEQQPQKQPEQEQEEEEEEEEEEKVQQGEKLQEKKEIESDQKLYANQIYDCYKCQGQQNECQTCSNKGFLTEEDGIVRLISQIVDFKLEQVFNQQKQQQQNKMNQDEQQQHMQDQKLEEKNTLKQAFQNVIHGIKDMVQNNNSQEEKQKELFKKVKPQTFKAKFDGNPEPKVNAKAGDQYKWSVVLKNSGECNWPQNTRFYCTQGPYFSISEKVLSQGPNESFQIDLHLQAPVDQQINNQSQIITWRLGYEDKNGKIHSFGPRVAYELNILNNEDDKMEKEDQQNISCQEADPKIISQNKKVLEKAEGLQTVFGGEIKQYITFINESKLQDVELEEIVELYLQKSQ